MIEAFNANMPYDRFVILQLAGGDEHSQTKNNYEPDVQGLDSDGLSARSALGPFQSGCGRSPAELLE